MCYNHIYNMDKVKISIFFKKILSELFVDKYNCIVCDDELQEKSSVGLCQKCHDKLTYINDNMCKKCGRLQYNEADYCLTCQAHKRHFDFARSCVVYDDVAMEIVRGIKFGGKRYFGKYIADFLVERYQSQFDGVDVDIAIPVPLTKAKKKIRGFNQSLEIAKTFCERSALALRCDLLTKIRDTKEQAKLSGEERESNLKDAYRVEKEDEVKDKNILIVDDVMTTGSTASEIAHTLKKAGAASVYLLTFASTRYKVGRVVAEDATS